MGSKPGPATGTKGCFGPGKESITKLLQRFYGLTFGRITEAGLESRILFHVFETPVCGAGTRDTQARGSLPDTRKAEQSIASYKQATAKTHGTAAILQRLRRNSLQRSNTYIRSSQLANNHYDLELPTTAPGILRFGRHVQ
jgi:hypothetical protein